MSRTITDVHDIELPIWMRVHDLAREEGAFEDAVAAEAGRKYSEDFRKYVDEQLSSGCAVILLDAWDEVSDVAARRKLGDRIRDRQYSGRILLTSRIVGYDMTQPPLPEGKEVELVAWNWCQIESYVRVWFGGNRPQAKLFLKRLKEHPQFRGLARIPLMLMLLCQACLKGDLPTRRSDLYKKCLHGLFQSWHTEDKEHVGKYTETELSESCQV
jgi:predicted NACHT family NTPase